MMQRLPKTSDKQGEELGERRCRRRQKWDSKDEERAAADAHLCSLQPLGRVRLVFARKPNKNVPNGLKRIPFLGGLLLFFFTGFLIFVVTVILVELLGYFIAEQRKGLFLKNSKQVHF